MPLYPYTCPACGHAFEALVTTTNGTTTVECPECGNDKPERGFGLPAKPAAGKDLPATNCRGDGPPCGAPWCGRKSLPSH
jgi:putative FmdB family regulatory protein